MDVDQWEPNLSKPGAQTVVRACGSQGVPPENSTTYHRFEMCWIQAWHIPESRSQLSKQVGVRAWSDEAGMTNTRQGCKQTMGWKWIGTVVPTSTCT